jgi:hypothetical protein
LVSCFFSRTAAARVMPTMPITALKSSICNRRWSVSGLSTHHNQATLLTWHVMNMGDQIGKLNKLRWRVS